MELTLPYTSLQVSFEFMERCTKSLYSTGGDAFISICLWQAGYAMTDPGLGLFIPGLQVRQGALRCGDMEHISHPAYAINLAAVSAWLIRWRGGKWSNRRLGPGRTPLLRGAYNAAALRRHNCRQHRA